MYLLTIFIYIYIYLQLCASPTVKGHHSIIMSLRQGYMVILRKLRFDIRADVGVALYAILASMLLITTRTTNNAGQSVQPELLQAVTNYEQ